MIRPGRDTDAPGYRALIAACWGEYPGIICDFAAEMPEIDRLASHMAEHGGALWSAEAAGAIVGMVAAYKAPDGWHVARLYVAAAHRGSGLAAALLATAEAGAVAGGATEIVLWTDMLFTRAHAFYEKQGYVRRGGLRTLQDLSNSIEARYWKPLTGRVVEALDVAAAESAERTLAGLLQACTQAGAATPFLPPVSREAAQAYWRGVTQAVGRGETGLLLAWREGVVAGSAQLDWRATQTGRHRAMLHTLLVAPGDRCRGMARALLAAAETLAAGAGRTLLLTEAPADQHSEALYERAGWVEIGTFPAPPSEARLYWRKLT